MKKLLFGILPVMFLLVMTTFVMATGISYSLREAPNELKDVNINSNGIGGNGAIITGYSISRIVYQFEQKSGIWQERTQIGTIRGDWKVVTVNYNPLTGIWSVPSLGLSVKTINLR